MSPCVSLFICCEKQYSECWAYCAAREVKRSTARVLSIANFCGEETSFKDHLSFIFNFCESFTKQLVYTSLIISL